MNMKFLVISLLVTAILGCKNAEKNPGSSGIPEGMSCPGSLDPNQACPDAVNATGPVKADPITKPVKPEGKPVSNEISGSCEMMVKGEAKPRTCEELQLTVTSIRNNEVRHAQISGFDVKFENLSEKAYRFHAASNKYWVKAKTGELRPGQSLKIQVFAKPRTHK